MNRLLKLRSARFDRVALPLFTVTLVVTPMFAGLLQAPAAKSAGRAAPAAKRVSLDGGSLLSFTL